MQAPPFLVSYSNLEEYLYSLSDDTLQQYGGEIASLTSKNLPPVVSRRCLAVLFGYSPKFVGSLIIKTEKYYRVFSIKKGNKSRKIEAPRVALKVIQKWLSEHLSNTLEFEDCVHGFVKGRSYISAAQEHLNANWIYSIDIKDFFQSTPQDKVIEAFKNLGYPTRGAIIASKLCCYRGFLSQGSPASPVLSNLVFTDLDKEISARAKDLGVTYTRYADDLVFSGKSNFPEGIKEFKDLIVNQGWVLSDKKEHYAEQPNRLKVHGLLVHGDRVRLTKGYRNKIRAFRHLFSQGRIDNADIARVRGHIDLASHIESLKSE